MAQSKTSSVKKRDRSASEDKLIAAATTIFSKYGYKGATTRMIAQKAGVNESLIGRYFDGKEGLLIAIIGRFIEEIHNEELPYPPQDTVLEELTLYMEAKITGSREREALGKIIISQSLTDNKFRKRVLEAVPMQCDERLMNRLERLKEASQIPPHVDLKEVCEEIENYLHGTFLFHVALGEKPREQVTDQVRKFAKHFTYGFMA